MDDTTLGSFVAIEVPAPRDDLTLGQDEQDRMADGIVVFGARWCAPFQLLAKARGRLQRSAEKAGVVYREIDVDADPAEARRHGIVSLPSFLVLSDGRERQRLVGAVGDDELSGLLRGFVDARGED